MGSEVLAELEVGAPVHGGHCLARLDGRVVFVRHALPGERVRARLTESSPGRGYWRADAVEVLDPSPDRVPSVWPEAGPGGVGGGELAHVALPAQRRWKAAVVRDALLRIGRLDHEEVEVEAAPDDDERGGLGWRTRIELTADSLGRAGMFRYRSHEIVPLTDMPLAVRALRDLGIFEEDWRPGARIDAIAPQDGQRSRPLVLLDGEPAQGSRRAVREVVRAGDRELTYKVSGAGFWQVHRRAPQLLVEAVLQATQPEAGHSVLELYSGAGLFTLPLAEAVGELGRVDAVEADAGALRDARRNVHKAGHVVLHEADVARALGEGAWRAPDAVVLDPPRSGAGPEVMAAICALGPARVVYVACDPAALARDLAAAAEHGYRLASLRAFDLFPHTHHVECVAELRRA